MRLGEKMKKRLINTSIVIACIFLTYGIAQINTNGVLGKGEVSPLMQTEPTYETLEKLNLSDPYFKENKILEGYTIPSNLYIHCRYTDSSILVTTSDSHYIKNQFSLPEGIYEYNFKTEEMKLVADKMSKKNHIKAVAYDNGYLVWEEDPDELISEVNSGKKWKTYLKDMATGEVIKVDEYNRKNSSYASGGYKYRPDKIDIDGENIVYKIDEVNDKKETIHIVKIYNIKTKELKEIKKSQSIDKDIFSEPDVDGDKVVFCRHSRAYIDSEVFIYDIKSQELDIVEAKGNEKAFSDVKINGNTVAISKAEYSVYNNINDSFTSMVSLYDINTKTFESVRDPVETKYDSISGTGIKFLSDGYLAFYGGTGDNSKVYDVKAKKYIDLLRDEEKKEYLTKGVGKSFDNLMVVYMWKSEYHRNRIYVLEK